MKAFINPHDPDNVAIKATLSGWLRTKLALNDDAEVSVHEHLCSEPSCVHAETVFKVENGQNTVDEGNPEGGGKGLLFYKIAKPIVYIRKWDLDAMKKIETPMKHAH
jgi:hypothetical protein